jgi:toxin YoeB
MEVIYLPEAKEHLEYWIKTGNKTVIKKIRMLQEDILKNGFSGIGKPEPLKHNWSGYWSRRIDKEHRFIYEIDNNTVFVYSLKGHYK